MTLQQIQYFIHTAKTGSIGKTSKDLYVSQSSVSSAIHELEEHYGVRLFHRSSKGVSLTSEGADILSELQTIMHKLTYLDEKYSAQGSNPLLFSVAAQHHVCGHLAFVETIRRAMQTNCNFSYLECSTATILDCVERGYAEIGVLFYSEVFQEQLTQELQKRDLSSHLICQEPTHVLLYRDHPLLRKTKLYMADLEGYPCITYDRILKANPLSGDMISTHPQRIGVTDRATAYLLMRELLAFAVVARDSAADGEGDYQARPVADADHNRVIWVTRSNYTPTPLAETFLSLLPVSE